MVLLLTFLLVLTPVLISNIDRIDEQEAVQMESLLALF